LPFFPLKYWTAFSKVAAVTVSMLGNDPVAYARVLAAPRATVWHFLEEDALRELWWPGAQMELSRGGTVNAARSPNHPEELEGNIDVLVSGHAAGFVWAKPDELFQTSVLIALHSYEQQTKVNITEFGFDVFENATARAVESEEAWTLLVEALEKVLNDR